MGVPVGVPADAGVPVRASTACAVAVTLAQIVAVIKIVLDSTVAVPVTGELSGERVGGGVPSSPCAARCAWAWPSRIIRQTTTRIENKRGRKRITGLVRSAAGVDRPALGRCFGGMAFMEK